MTARRIAILFAAVCVAIICYLLYIGKFMVVTGAAFGIGWLFLKITLAAALVVSGFFLLHPLTFMLRVRGTPAGQRGHFRFTHLFGLLWLDAGIDRRARDVHIGFWRWSWRIAGGRQPRPERKPPSPPPSSPPSPSPAPSPVAQATGKAQTDAPSAAPPQPPVADAASRENTEKPAAPMAASPAAITGEPATVEAARPPQEQQGKVPSTPEPARTTEETVHPFPKPPMKENSFERPPRAPAKEAAPPREAPFGDRIRADLRRLRRRAADGWRKAKTWLKLAMRGWRRASPLVRRLAADLWNGVHMLPSVCRLRYGLSEAHLTGLTQGLAAPFAGLLRPFSIHFEPIPIFTGPTLHLSIDGGMSIQPWRIFWAWLVLLTTIDFWKAMRDLWQWHKARSKTSGGV